LKSLEPHQYKLSCRAFLPEKTAGKILIGKESFGIYRTALSIRFFK